MRELLEKIYRLNSIAIVGMEKNVGKTTTLNYLIEKANKNDRLGLTSIGIDGEKKDQVTGTEKPTLYLPKGTIIASAKKSYLSSDITKEILSTTGIQTPMGEVILFKALSDGYVELMGPSINKYLREVIAQLKVLGCDLVIVDGALNRSSTASPAIAEGVIMATGASVSTTMSEVVNQTAHKLSLLQIDYIRDENSRKVVEEALIKSKVSFMKENNLYRSNEATAIGAEKTIITALEGGADGIIINGMVGDRLVEHLINQRISLTGKRIYVEDGSKLFLNEDNFKRLKLKGMEIVALNPINILMVTVNPKAPEGYSFNSQELCQLIHCKTKLPVLDVMRNLGVGLKE
ncbi:lysine 5,6-aminomutase reactivase subunit KamB [Alkaliphilus transvaalensis]|uniref:lysine 5,6-aminomutase reactivase subunit KamB n=1 Tax=Alkaliphilus transvaalensis TaxID=114628 RepID=UPI00047AFA3D|nr:hypothetical protein [Alkaliphilus transvaalensis]